MGLHRELRCMYARQWCLPRAHHSPKSEAQSPLRLSRDASRLLPLYRPLHTDLGRYYPLGTYGSLYGRLPRPRGTLFRWSLYDGLLYGLDHRDTDACHPQCGCAQDSRSRQAGRYEARRRSVPSRSLLPAPLGAAHLRNDLGQYRQHLRHYAQWRAVHWR